jgi:hypothetical protein
LAGATRDQLYAASNDAWPVSLMIWHEHGSLCFRKTLT